MAEVMCMIIHYC